MPTRNLADAERGVYASLDDAGEAQRAIRVYAANFLSGGHATVEAIMTGGCSEPLLSESARAALEVLRTVGLPASLISDPEVRTVDIVHSGSSSLTVRYRYPRITGRQSEFSGLSESAFLAKLGLTLADFDAARRQLAEEIEAFGRSVGEDDYLPERRVPDVGMGVDDKLYVATATLPAAAPWSFHVVPISLTSDSGPIGFNARDALAVLDLQSAFSRSNIAESLTPGSGLEALSVRLGRASTAARTNIEGVFAYRLDDRDPMTDMEVAVATDRNPDDIVLVTSLRSVRCAIAGSIEGAACTWEDVAPVTVVESVIEAAEDEETHDDVNELIAEILEPLYSPSIAAGFEWRSGVKWLVDHALGRTVYVLRLKPGRPAEQPGSYEEFHAAEVRFVTDAEVTPTNTEAIGFYGIAPTLMSEAANFLRPSPDWCVTPAVECNGMSFSQRLPLEDELVDDGSATENSWQIYLRRAREAAVRADQLGEESLDRAFDVEQRAEGAIQELQEICGVEIDIDPFVAAATSGNPVEDLLSPPPGSPLASIGQSQRARLHRCLASDESSVVRAVVGSNPVCGWEDADGTFCGVPDGETTSQRCPYFVPVATTATGGAACSATPNWPMHPVSSVYVDQSLGLVSYVEAANQVSSARSTPSLCSQMRTLRESLENGSTSSRSLSEINASWERVFAESAFFTPDAIARAAEQISFEAAPGNYGTLLVRGKPYLSTGGLGFGPSVAGICDADVPFGDLGAGCASAASGLACSRQSCAEPEERSALNARMIAAATVARWLGGRSLAGFVVPDQHDLPSTKSAVREFFAVADAELRNMRTIRRDTESWSDGAPTIYCFDQQETESTQLDRLWMFAREDGYGYLPIENTLRGDCAGSRGIRFSRMADGYWGHKTTSTTLRNAHLLRAQGVLERLPSIELRNVSTPTRSIVGFGFGVDLMPEGEDLFVVSIPNGDDVHRPSSVRTAVPNASDSQNNYRLPWVEAQDDGGGLHTHPGVATYFATRKTIPRTALLDALELLCESGVGDPFPTFDPPQPTTKEAAERAVIELEKFAKALEARLATMTIDGLPADLLNDINGLAASGPEARGRYGAQLLRLTSSLKAYSTTQQRFQRSIDAVGRAMRRLSENADIAAAERSIERLNFGSTVSSQTSRCAAGVAGSTSSTPWESAGKMVAALIECQDAVRQIQYAAATMAERTRITNSQERLAYVEFGDALAVGAAELGDTAASLRAARDEFQAATYELSVVRDQGRRALSRAMFLDESGTGAVFATNTVSRARLRSSQARYERALRDAVSASFIAKRAIEQRFGVRLAAMNQDMQLVRAPSTWEFDRRPRGLSGLDRRPRGLSGRTEAW